MSERESCGEDGMGLWLDKIDVGWIERRVWPDAMIQDKIECIAAAGSPLSAIEEAHSA